MTTGNSIENRQNIDDPGLFEPSQRQITVNHKIAGISLDDAYIFNFVNNPKMGKAEALRLAGWDGNPDYCRQEAYRRHARLKAKIQAVTAELLGEVGTLANHQLTTILNMDIKDTGVNSMLAAIKLGLEASNIQAPALLEEPKRTSDEIDERIEALKKQIAEVEGETAA